MREWPKVLPVLSDEFLKQLIAPKAEAHPAPNPAHEPDWLKEVTLAERNEPFLAYLRTAEPDDKSQKSQTWNVIREGVRAFAIYDPATAMVGIMQEYNPRCVPPWPEDKIRHKVFQSYNKAEGPEWGSGLDAHPINELLHRHKACVAELNAADDPKAAMTTALTDADTLTGLSRMNDLELDTFLAQQNAKGVPQRLCDILRRTVKSKSAELDRARREELLGRPQQQYHRFQPMKPVLDMGDGDVTEEDVKDLERHVLLQKGNNFSLFDFARGKYSTVKIAKELNILIQRYWRDAGAPLEFWYEGADGSLKEKTVDRLLRDYGTNIEGMCYDLTLQESRYDARTRTLSLATCPLRDLEPREDAQIDTWLRLMAGEHAEMVMRWLATVMRQDELNCCLFLVGAPGTGKSLLAAGLARLWRKAGPCELEHAVGRFNDDLINCPLTVLDEGIKLVDAPGGLSNQIRSLIGNKDRLLNAKFVSGVQIHGGLRLMITANNTRVLDMLASEDMGEDDINAIAERLLVVQVPEAAAQHLAKLQANEPDLIQSWVEDDLIARHVLHLRDTMTIVRDGRFLVCGQKTNLHSELAMRNPEMSVVLEWVTKFVLDPSRLARSETPGARVGNGRILIHPTTVREQWVTYMNDEPKPSRDAIIRHLKANSRKIECRVDRKRFYDVTVSRITDYAASRFLAEKKQLTDLINQLNDQIPGARSSSR